MAVARICRLRGSNLPKGQVHKDIEPRRLTASSLCAAYFHTVKSAIVPNFCGAVPTATKNVSQTLVTFLTLLSLLTLHPP